MPDSSIHVEVVDHTADIGLRAVAPSAQAAFVAIAEAMFDILAPGRDHLEERETWEVTVVEVGWENLLVAWLEDLLYRFEMDLLVPRTIAVERLTSNEIIAQLRGERLDPRRHETGVQIKAVTYHRLRAEETGDGFEIEVIFDI